MKKRFLLVAILASCSRSPAPDDESCRTVPSQRAGTSAGGAISAEELCDWDGETREFRCTRTEARDNVSWTWTSVRRFASVAAFVADKPDELVEEGRGSKCCNATRQRTWTYDADGEELSSLIRYTYAGLETRTVEVACPPGGSCRRDDQEPFVQEAVGTVDYGPWEASSSSAPHEVCVNVGS